MLGMITQIHCSWLQLLPSLPSNKHTKAAPLFLTFPMAPQRKCAATPPSPLLPQLAPAVAQVHCCHPLRHRQHTGRVQAAPAHQGMEKLVKSSFRNGANRAHHSCMCI